MFYRFGKTYPEKLLLLPGEIIEKADAASETELRILLKIAPILAHSGAEEGELMEALSDSFSQEEILTALAFWRGCGIFKTENKKSEKKPAPRKLSSEEEPIEEEKKAEPEKKVIDADEAPFYSSADLAEAAKTVPDFKNLVSFAEQRLEKVMNTSELARLYSFLDYLKMPLDVVILAIEDCVTREKKSLRYITKVLTAMQDEGIDSFEKAEEYFRIREEKRGYEAIVRRLFGLGTRKLTAAEEVCVKTWQSVYNYGEEMLTAAYEKTVAAAKNPSIRYMHKILENWHASGYTTPAETEQAPAKNAEKADKSYDVDDFFRSAVSKGRKKL